MMHDLRAPLRWADGRMRRPTSVVDRPGPREFRDRVLRAYGFACAVPGEVAPEVLEAAHIQPYVDERSNDPRNSFALRIDLHQPFDAGLIKVDADHRVRVSPRLVSSESRSLDGRPVRLSVNAAFRPATAALEYHRTAVFKAG